MNLRSRLSTINKKIGSKSRSCTIFVAHDFCRARSHDKIFVVISNPTLDHLLELNANYNPKFQTENQKTLRQTTEELDVLSLGSNESSRLSSPDPSQELESVKSLIQTGARKMSERVAGFKNLWASYTRASDTGQKSHREISWSYNMTDGPTISGQSLIKSSGDGTSQFG